MTRSEKIKFLILRSIGNFLVLISLYGVAATFGPAGWSEAKFQILRARGIHYTIADIGKFTPEQIKEEEGKGLSLGSVLAGEKEQTLIPKDTNFSIIIPKIGASSLIIPNVDSSDPKSFLPALQKGVAHAKGTVFPGLPGNTYIFAHSTDSWWNVGRYNAVFYLLKDLQKGDDIVIFFEGRRHNYLVDQTFVADASEVRYLLNSHGGPEQLVLQTCWPPGTTWKRIFVIAKPRANLSDGF